MANLKAISIVVSAIFCLISCNDAIKDKNNDVQKKHDGYVPDEFTAKKIAEAIWLPIYGPSIADEKPYIAKVRGDSVWVIEGTLDRGKAGGTAYIEIRIADCKILTVTHGK